MELTHEEIERGLREIGLSNDEARQALSGLSLLPPAEKRPTCETITTAHTSLESKEPAHAELEPSS